MLNGSYSIKAFKQILVLSLYFYFLLVQRHIPPPNNLVLSQPSLSSPYFYLKNTHELHGNKDYPPAH
jgi:hypothetical protein